MKREDAKEAFNKVSNRYYYYASSYYCYSMIIIIFYCIIASIINIISYYYYSYSCYLLMHVTIIGMNTLVYTFSSHNMHTHNLSSAYIHIFLVIQTHTHTQPFSRLLFSVSLLLLVCCVCAVCDVCEMFYPCVLCVCACPCVYVCDVCVCMDVDVWISV